ncbi:MAG: serine hydrolase [Burkholderiales bacterium]|nr:serine hydrolase [Bacteroidia bacterium]
MKKVNSDYKKYRLQIIYTQITRDREGHPTFTDYRYHVDSSNYFYCASLVKLPCSILAFEKIKNLRVPSNSIMFTDSTNACQRSVREDTSSISGYPSIAQYIKRMALVSDNFAYGRVYEFLGVDYIHNRLGELGYKNIRIVHRFDGGCKGAEHTITNQVSFCKSDFTPITTQPQQEASKLYSHPLGEVKVGRAHLNAQNKKINQPKDFTNMNYISLENIHSMLKRLIFSNDLPYEQRYDLLEDDRQFLIEQLTSLPRESSHPTYNKSYYDSYKKYFMFGDSKKPMTNNDIKITNIVGQSYGFMVDCAYIQNKKENVEFMLSAVIYANEDEIINDGKYEYNTIAMPFLAELGRQIYAYELKRR